MTYVLERPYRCPRCNFQTFLHESIVYHFYEDPVICKPKLGNIELTEEIKDKILNTSRKIVWEKQKKQKTRRDEE